MKTPSSLFNNVIRLDIESKIKETYEAITESIIEASSGERALVEFTFGSTELDKHFPGLLKKYSKDIEISLGTVCTKEEALKAIEWSNGNKLKVFAPHYSREIKELFENTKIEYIPGMRTMDEYKRFTRDHAAMKSTQEIKCKVYPCTNEDEEELLNAISGPYPELSLKENRERILIGLKRIEPDTLSTKTYMIKTPFEYSQIREQFLTDKDLQFIIQNPSQSAIELVRGIRKEQPEAFITATGMSQIGDAEAEFLKAGADTLGSSSAVKNALTSFKENQDLDKLRSQIKENLLKTHDQLSEAVLK